MTYKLVSLYATQEGSDGRFEIHLRFYEGDKYYTNVLEVDDYIGDTPQDFADTLENLANKMRLHFNELLEKRALE